MRKLLRIGGAALVVVGLLTLAWAALLLVLGVFFGGSTEVFSSGRAFSFIGIRAGVGALALSVGSVLVVAGMWNEK